MGDTPDLSGLPGWAQVLGYAIFAMSIASIGIVARFGWKIGKSDTGGNTTAKTAEVAAVIVDPEALNNATAAVTQLVEVMGRLTDVVGQHVADQREEREEREIEDEVDRRVEERERLKRRRPRATKARPVKT